MLWKKLPLTRFLGGVSSASLLLLLLQVKKEASFEGTLFGKGPCCGVPCYFVGVTGWVEPPGCEVYQLVFVFNCFGPLRSFMFFQFNIGFVVPY